MILVAGRFAEKHGRGREAPASCPAGAQCCDSNGHSETKNATAVQEPPLTPRAHLQERRTRGRTDRDGYVGRAELHALCLQPPHVRRDREAAVGLDGRSEVLPGQQRVSRSTHTQLRWRDVARPPR